MSDFVHFLGWLVCVFVSALGVAGLAGDYWHFQSPSTSILLPLCLSFMVGSFVFLGFWKIRVWRRRYANLIRSNLIACNSNAISALPRSVNLRSL
jgi:hypothetical protein